MFCSDILDTMYLWNYEGINYLYYSINHVLYIDIKRICNMCKREIKCLSIIGKCNMRPIYIKKHVIDMKHAENCQKPSSGPKKMEINSPNLTLTVI